MSWGQAHVGERKDILNKALFIFATGLIPLWVVIVTTIARGGVNVGTGFLITYSLPWFIPSFIVSIVTSVVYEREDNKNKLKSSVTVFSLCYILLCVVLVWNLSSNSNSDTKNNQQTYEINYLGKNGRLQQYEIKNNEIRKKISTEQFEIKRFARNNASILEYANKIHGINIMTKFSDQYDSLPSRYMLLIYGKNGILKPVIEVYRTETETKFSVVCFVPHSQKDRIKFNSTCKDISSQPTSQ